jgi:hypothetical protein
MNYLKKGINECPLCKKQINKQVVEQVTCLNCCGCYKLKINKLLINDINFVKNFFDISLIGTLCCVVLMMLLIIPSYCMKLDSNISYCDDYIRQCEYYGTSGTIIDAQVSGSFIKNTYLYLNSTNDNVKCYNITKYDNPFGIEDIAQNEINNIVKIFVKQNDPSMCMTKFINYNKEGIIMNLIFDAVLFANIAGVFLMSVSLFTLIYIKEMNLC